MSYWREADFRLNPEHPPLLKALAALPALGSARWPKDGDEGISARAARRAWNAAPGGLDSEWVFAYSWLYGPTDAALARVKAQRISQAPTQAAFSREDFVNDADALFALARLPLVALALLLAAGVWLWSRELNGPEGGLLSLALFCFSPSFLAHAPLVATDAGLAAFVFWAAYLTRRALRGKGPAAAAGAAACCALAFVSKFSAALLVPVYLALAAAAALEASGRERARRLRRAALLAAGAAALTYAAIWAAYGLRYSGAPGAASGYRWADVLSPGGGPFARLLSMARERRLLPEGWLYGLAFVRARAAERAGFFFGERSLKGWWWYFPAALALKTPLPVLGLVGAGLWGLRRRRAELAWLLAAPLVFGAAAMAARLNIGHRHLLPALPFLFVAAGAFAHGRRARARAGLGAAAAALSALLVFSPPWRPQAVYPDYLAYFNELAGGPARGWRALSDSDLDWGQGLKSLAAWLRERGIDEPVGLCYFGTAEPRYYGVRFVNLYGGLPFAPQEPWEKAPRWVAISATNIQGVYLDEEAQRSMAGFFSSAKPVLEGQPGRSIFVFRRDN